MLVVYEFNLVSTPSTASSDETELSESNLRLTDALSIAIPCDNHYHEHQENVESPEHHSQEFKPMAVSEGTASRGCCLEIPA